jgi:hypothetical protein
LKVLAARFDDEAVKVDITVGNAARIWKPYGTKARKGDGTGDRPHRLAQILIAPKQPTVVGVEKLEALAALVPGPKHGQSPGRRLDVAMWLKDRGIPHRLKPNLASGERETYLIACPFNDEHKDAAIMQDGDGKLSAKCFHNSCADKHWQQFKEKIGPPAPEHFDEPDELGLELVDLDTIEPKEQTWLWNKRIPKRGVTIVAGDGGVGKSVMVVDICTRVTTGTEFPDGSPCRKGRVLLFNAEDDPETVLRPRFDAHRADCKLVTIQGQDAKTPLNLGDRDGIGLKALEKACETSGIELLVIDPLTAYMAGKDINDDAQVRAVLRPLTLIAQRHDIAVIAIMHFTKDEERRVKYRTLGSVGFVNAARAASTVGKEYDEDEVTHFLNVKQNYTKNVAGLAFTLDDVCGVPRVRWCGTSDLSPDKLGKGSKKEQQRKFMKWIGGWCEKEKVDSITDATLQQSGLPGTKGNADFCRQMLKELAQAGCGEVKEEGRKALRFRPKTGVDAVLALAGPG